MADQQRNHPLMPPDLKALYVDNGDGTYSLKVSAAVASGPIQTAAKGTTASGNPTSTAVDGNTQALDVYIRSTGGSGGGPATIADGADVAQGTTTDLSSASTVVGILKAIKAAITGTLLISGAVTEADGANVTLGASTDAAGAATIMGRLRTIANNQGAGGAAGTSATTGTIMQGIESGTTRRNAVISAANGLVVDVSRVLGNVAVTEADGANVTLGTSTDANTANTVIGRLTKIRDLLAATLTVTGAGGTFPVTGTFWQATQPVSSAAASQVDGHSANIGALADASSASTLTGLLKAIKASVGGTLAVSLAAAILAKYDVLAAVAATASSVTGNAALVTLTVTNYNTVIVSERADAGTQTTPEAIIFEVSDDGSNWFTIEGVRLDTVAAPESTHTTAVSETRLWQFNVAAFIGWRVRQTTAIVGTGTVVWRAQASAASSQPRLIAEVPSGQNVVEGSTADAANASTIFGQLKQLATVITTKAAQATNAFQTQDVKDSGRSVITMTAVDQVLAVGGTEILLSFTTSAADAANSAGVTTYQVTAGKRLRVQALVFTIRASATSVPNARIRVRTTASGAVGLTSPLQFVADIGFNVLTAAAAVVAEMSGAYSVVVPIPDGWELPAGHNIGFTWVSTNATTALNMTLIGYEY